MGPQDETLRPDELLAQLGWVRALARSLVADPEAGDDVLQQVCLLALQKAPRDARAGPGLRAWLATVTRNLARHSGREATRRTLRERAVAQPEALPSTIDIAAHREALKHLVDAVTSLAEPDYSVVFARYFDGRSVAEIAELRGVSSAAVRQQLSRARSRLRSRLQSTLADHRQGWFLTALPLGSASGALKSASAKSLLASSGGLLVAKTVPAVVIVVAGLLAIGGWFALHSTQEARHPPAEAPAIQGAGVLSAAPPAVFDPALAAHVPPSPVEALGAATAGSAPEDAAPEVPAPPPGRASLHVIVTWESDETPAVNVHFRLHFWNTPGALRHPVDGVTDAHGEWFAPSVPPGKVTLYTDRSATESASLVAGQAGELRVVIPKGLLVRGLVTDPDAHAVPGAGVWLSDYGNDTEGAVVGTTDASGRFELRDVADWHSVGARSAKHAPSGLVAIKGAAGDTVDVVLVVGGPCGAVRVTVLDPDGAPVPEARVRLELAGLWRAPEGQASKLTPPAPLELLTLADGSCLAEGVPPGRVPMSVVREGLSPAQAMAEVREGETAEVTLSLFRSARISGLVRDGDGRAVQGASVGIGNYDDFLNAHAETGADGRYELRDVLLGSQLVFASERALGRAKVTLSIEPGADLAWDPVLQAGATISGTLLDPDGRPAPSTAVVADSHDQRMPIAQRALTEADGHFALVNLGTGAYRLTTEDPGIDDAAVLLAESVEPGTHDLVLTLPRGMGQPSWVTGRIVDGSGVPLKDLVAFIMDHRTRRAWNCAFAPDGTTSGEFKAGPMPGGEYALLLQSPHWPNQTLARVTVPPGQTVALGDLVAHAGGTLLVRLTAPGGVPADGVWANLKESPTQYAGSLELQEGALRSAPVVAGNYLLEITARDLAVVRRDVTLEEGRETVIDVALEPGVRQRINYFLDVSAGSNVVTKLWARTPAGEVVWESERRWPPMPDSELPAAGRPALIDQVTLRPGAYDVEVWLGDLKLPPRSCVVSATSPWDFAAK